MIEVNKPLLSAALLEERQHEFNRLLSAQRARLAAKPKDAITITLRDGSAKAGTRWETSPMDIAMQISKNLATACELARIEYTEVDESLNRSSGLETLVMEIHRRRKWAWHVPRIPMPDYRMCP